jgi:hypothetical protein
MNATQPQRLDTDNDRIQPNPAVYTTSEPASEPSLGQLFTSLTEDFSTLVRSEIRLAKAETMESVSTATRGAGMMAAGGFVAYAGLLLVLMGIAVLIGQAIDSYWLGALLVGVLTLGVGAVLFFSGKSAMKDVNLTPDKTIESIKDDARMVKEQLS